MKLFVNYRCINIQSAIMISLIIFINTSVRETDSALKRKNKQEYLSTDPIFKYSTLSNSKNLKETQKEFSRLYTYLEDDNTHILEAPAKTSDKIVKLLILYCQFFIIFSIISFYRWFEEMSKIKTLHVENKYSNFIDLTDSLHKDLNLDYYEGLYVYSAGKPEIKESAKDNMFINVSPKKMAKIERRVEIYDVDEEKWSKLGYIGIKEETTPTNFDLNTLYVTYINEEYMQASFSGQIYTFPKIVSSMFLGIVELQNIEVNYQQLKTLEVYEKLMFPSQPILSEFFKEYDSNEFNVSEFDVDGDFLIIYPCDKEFIDPRKSKCKVRVSLRGVRYKLFNLYVVCV